MSSISVIVPVYQSEESLDELCQRLTKSLRSVVSTYEILLVEDCGPDGSWNKIVQLAAKDSHIRAIRFSRNFGQHYAITAGLDHCTCDWAVVMDCDLQDRPEDIPALYKKAQEGFDIVLAVRATEYRSLRSKILVGLFYSVFNFLTDRPYDSRIGNFRIISKPVIESFREFREQMRFFGALVQWMGFPVATVDVQHDDRPYGKSAYNYRRLFALGFNTVIAYSDFPLRLSIGFGFLTVVVSFFMAALVIYRSIYDGSSLLGWSSLFVAVSFFSGVIIFNLGLIGLYLGKAFDEAKRRPLYIVHKKLNLS